MNADYIAAGKTVDDLRKDARANGAKGAGMLRWNREALIHFIRTGEEPAAPAPGAGQDAAAILGILAKALEPLMGALGGKVDEDAVIDLIQKHSPVKTIEVKVDDYLPKKMGTQHYLYEDLLRLASIKSNGRRLNIMLVGPAASGKTHVWGAVAEALGLKFYPQSVCGQTTESRLLGYTAAARGEYISQPLYTAYKEGGVYLLDEVDNGNANVLNVLNAGTSNGGMMFPNGEWVPRHPDFVMVAAANTYGLGRSKVFVGRVQLDAAFLSRFLVVDFGYDENMERALYGDTPWTRRVQAVRKKAADLGELVCITPRSTEQGNALLLAGFPEDKVAEWALWKGMDPSIRSRIDVR